MSDSTPSPAAGPGGEAAGAGLDPKVGGLLAYLLSWIGGLIMFLTQKHPEVRFHGMQSILYNVAAGVVVTAIWILGTIAGMVLGPLGLLFNLLGFVAWLAAFVGWILLCVKGYGLEHYKLPLIGDFAEQWSGYRTAA